MTLLRGASAFAIVVLVASVPHLSHGVSLEYLSDDRSVFIRPEWNSWNELTEIPPAPFADFDVHMGEGLIGAEVAQVSTLGPLFAEASGLADALNAERALSAFDVRFLLERDVEYTLVGHLRGVTQSDDGYSDAIPRLELVRLDPDPEEIHSLTAGGVYICCDETPPPSLVEFDLSGLLPAGE